MPKSEVIEDLGTLREIVVDSGEVGAELEGTRAEIIDQLRDYAAALGFATDWPKDVLLDKIGCPHGTEEELHNLPLERLQDCERFLRLILDGVEAVATIPDSREVTMTFAELLLQVPEGPAALSGLLKEGDRKAPWRYVELGEITRAAAATRIRGDIARPGDRDDEGPFAAAAVVHISTPRLDSHIRGERQMIGDAVFEAITDHLDGCGACSDAARYRREQLGV